MGNFKAQAATEYIIIIGMVLVVTIPLFYYAMQKSNVNIKLNQAEDVVNTLARAADTVYSIGPGTKKYVWVNMPKGVESYSTAEKTVSITLSIFGGSSDYTARAKAELVGVVPISKGRHKVKVEMLESGYVRFGEADDTLAPIVIWTDPSGTINYMGIWIMATTNEYSSCKYNTEAQGDADYFSMSNLFVGSALTHEKDLGILAEGNHVYYVRCIDPSENKMTESAIINFTIVPPLSGNATNGSLPGTNETHESYPPVISLISPEDGYTDNDSIILFEYNVTDNSSIWFCELIINDTVDQTDYAVIKNMTQNFTKLEIDYGNYMWNISCSDVHGNMNFSETRTFSVNYTLDNDAPLVTLISPPDNTIRNYWLTKFSYNVSDAMSLIDYCDLHMYGELDEGGVVNWDIRDTDVTKNITESIFIPLFKANYTWNISCVDDSYSANEGYSETWKLRVNVSAGEEAFIDSCGGFCGVNGYVGGDCRQNVGKCTSDGYVAYLPDGDIYCTVGPPTPNCCCLG